MPSVLENQRETVAQVVTEDDDGGLRVGEITIQATPVREPLLAVSMMSAHTSCLGRQRSSKESGVLLLTSLGRFPCTSRTAFTS